MLFGKTPVAFSALAIIDREKNGYYNKYLDLVKLNFVQVIIKQGHFMYQTILIRTVFTAILFDNLLKVFFKFGAMLHQDHPFVL